MRLQNVSFAAWLASPTHGEKPAKERWLRELYPWPVLAQVDCDEGLVGARQMILHDEVAYTATLRSVEWQSEQGTFKYRVRVDSDGLGWHARSFADNYDMIGSRDGTFVTVFNVEKKEPLERIASAFFGRRWTDLAKQSHGTLAASRFLAADLVGRIAEEAYAPVALDHYPRARLVGGAPMLAHGDELWIGHRYYSEDAFAWARQNAGRARHVVAVYLADTKYQFQVDLPRGSEVHSASELDGRLLGGRYEELIRVLLRRLELPMLEYDSVAIDEALMGKAEKPQPVAVSEGDVHEALSAFRNPCRSKDDLRYQLAAGVVLNRWIEDERRLGYRQRKPFYAFKQHIDRLGRWAMAAPDDDIAVWREEFPSTGSPLLFVRVEGVDLVFDAIPLARELIGADRHPTWTGVRLKPIAPLVLAWARELRAP